MNEPHAENATKTSESHAGPHAGDQPVWVREGKFADVADVETGELRPVRFASPPIVTIDPELGRIVDAIDVPEDAARLDPGATVAIPLISGRWLVVPLGPAPAAGAVVEYLDKSANAAGASDMISINQVRPKPAARVGAGATAATEGLQR